MKNETKHTPGPWHIANYGETDPSFEIVQGDLGIASIVCPRKHGEKRVPKQDAAEANAQLIAAAPDLLAALKAVVARLTQPVQFSQNTTEATCGILREDAASVVAMVKRELARAEGRGE